MACDYRAILSRYVDGELPTDQERLLKDHLPRCDSCRGTIRLLRMEDRAIQGALLGLAPQGRKIRPPARTLRVALILGVLACLGLLLLYGAYERVADRVVAAGPDSAPDLERPVLVEADGTPLTVVLETVSRETGVRVDLSAAAKLRLGHEPSISIRLVKPIRLSSLLQLLEDFYGLVPRTSGGTVLLD